MMRLYIAVLILAIAGGAAAVADNPTQLANERLIRIVTNNKDLEVCLVNRFSTALDAVTITTDLFRTSPGPYAEVTTICETKKPIVRDRYGQPLATLAIDMCATTVDAYQGTAFWDGIANTGVPTSRLKRLSRRLTIIAAAGEISSICEKITVDGGRHVVDWMLDISS